MTIKELIERLQKLEPNLEVFFEDEDHRPIPITTITKMPVYQPYLNEEGKKRFHFFDGVVLWNE